MKLNTFEGGTNGSPITLANSGAASGDAFDIIVAANAGVPAGGSTAVIYSTAAAVNGALGCRMTPATTATYLRFNETAIALRYVMRRSFRITANPAATTEVMAMRNASAAVGAVRIDTSGRPVIAAGSGTPEIAASKPAAGLAPGVYFVELAITLESGAGGNGQAQFRITTTDDTVVHAPAASTGLATGTSPVTNYRFGGVLTTSGWAQDDADSVAGSDLGSGWIGPLANSAPSATITGAQNVTAGSPATATVTATDSDGTIASYAWTVVSSASTATPTLTGASTATVSFTAPAAGSLVTLQCVVTDSGGATVTKTTEVRVPVSGATAGRPLALDATGAGSWTVQGGSATGGAALADESDATYLESADLTGTETSRRVRLQPSGARATAQLKQRLWTDTGTATVTVRLYEGTTLRQSWTQPLTSTPTEYTLALSSTAIAAVADWGNLYLEVAGVA